MASAIRQSCVIAFLRRDTCDAFTTAPRSLNSRERKLIASFGGAAVWVGCEEQSDLWRLPLQGERTLHDLKETMRRWGFPPCCGPFYGTGTVNLVASGQGTQEQADTAKRRQQTARRRMSIDTEKGGDVSLLFLSLFGNSCPTIKVDVPALHPCWEGFIGSGSSHKDQTQTELTLSLWRRMNDRFLWFGECFTHFHNLNNGSREWQDREAVLNAWIVRNSRKLPSY